MAHRVRALWNAVRVQMFVSLRGLQRSHRSGSFHGKNAVEVNRQAQGTLVSMIVVDAVTHVLDRNAVGR